MVDETVPEGPTPGPKPHEMAGSERGPEKPASGENIPPEQRHAFGEAQQAIRKAKDEADFPHEAQRETVSAGPAGPSERPVHSPMDDPFSTGEIGPARHRYRTSPLPEKTHEVLPTGEVMRVARRTEGDGPQRPEGPETRDPREAWGFGYQLERIRHATVVPEVRSAVRRMLYIMEENEGMPMSTYDLQNLRNTLEEKVDALKQTFNEQAKKYYVVRPKIDQYGQYEIDPATRTIKREIVEIEKDTGDAIITECERFSYKKRGEIRGEIAAREPWSYLFHRIWLPLEGSRPHLANLFVHPDFSKLYTRKHFETLFNLPEIGPMIDKELRWWALLGMMGRKGSDGETPLVAELYKKYDWVRNLVEPEDLALLLDKKYDSDKTWKKWEDLGSRERLVNIFAEAPDEDVLDDLIDELRERMWRKFRTEGATEEDIETAETYAWYFLHMSGMSAWLALHPTEIKVNDSPPISNELTHIFHFYAFRKSKFEQGDPQGPNTIAETPYHAAVDFLRHASVGAKVDQDGNLVKDENGEYIFYKENKIPKNSKARRSFWELWFHKGIELGKLPWGKLDPMAWRGWLLHIFFAARPGEHGPASLYDLVTFKDWRLAMWISLAEENMKMRRLQDGRWNITAGEYELWYKLTGGTDGDLKRVKDELDWHEIWLIEEGHRRIMRKMPNLPPNLLAREERELSLLNNVLKNLQNPSAAQYAQEYKTRRMPDKELKGIPMFSFLVPSQDVS